uniref:Uncharacterized protein n=1 Tax=Molossus molossus TaxID=27622 RepID=A0A7J8HC35_MOLMO|nr:hypothetical protein HJG59_011190 [Molossus molossus]
MNLHGHIILTQSLWFTSRSSLSGAHSMGLDKYIRTCIYHYSIMQRIFTALKTCALPIHYPTLSSAQPLANTDLFTVSIVLFFPECHIVGITQCVDFHIGFFHLVICFSDSSLSIPSSRAHFFTALSNIPLSGVPQFI